MKKKLLLIICCVALGICCLTGCGGTDMSGSPYLGTWTATTVEYAGIELGVADTLGGDWIFVLNDDGSTDMTISGETESGDWAETEGGFSVEDTFFFTVDGDNAVMEYEGMNIYFVR